MAGREALTDGGGGGGAPQLWRGQTQALGGWGPAKLRDLTQEHGPGEQEGQGSEEKGQ